MENRVVNGINEKAIYQKCNEIIERIRKVVKLSIMQKVIISDGFNTLKLGKIDIF